MQVDTRSQAISDYFWNPLQCIKKSPYMSTVMDVAVVVGAFAICLFASSYKPTLQEENYTLLVNKCGQEFDPDLFCPDFFLPSTMSGKTCSVISPIASLSERVCPSVSQFLSSVVMDFFLQTEGVVSAYSVDRGTALNDWVRKAVTISSHGSDQGCSDTLDFIKSGIFIPE